MAHPRILQLERSILLVIDVQEAFRNVIYGFTDLLSKTTIVVNAFQILGRPVIVTEQYPKGLGRTVEEILLSLPESVEPIEKTAFSSYGAASFLDRISADREQQIVICGIEAHVCVNQTVHDLIDHGYQVHILTDAVGSRTEKDREAGLAKMFGSGAVPSTVEMALFEMMRDSKHAKFREVQTLLK